MLLDQSWTAGFLVLYMWIVLLPLRPAQLMRLTDFTLSQRTLIAPRLGSRAMRLRV